MKKIILLILIINIVSSCSSDTDSKSFKFDKIGNQAFSEKENNDYIFFNQNTLSISNKKINISPFYLSKNELSNKEWIEFLSETKNVIQYDFKDILKAEESIPIENVNTNLPVRRITQIDAFLFCNWKSLKEKRQPCYDLTDTYENLENLSYTQLMKKIRVNKNSNGYRLPYFQEFLLAIEINKDEIVKIVKDAKTSDYFHFHKLNDNSPFDVIEITKKKSLSTGFSNLLGNVNELIMIPPELISDYPLNLITKNEHDRWLEYLVGLKEKDLLDFYPTMGSSFAFNIDYVTYKIGEEIFIYPSPDPFVGMRLAINIPSN